MGNNSITRAEQRGVWTTEEHDKFLAGLKAFPEGPWKAIADHVGTRSARQVQTHAQKYYEKVARRVRGLRKDRKKVVRSEHRLDEDMIELCKDVAGDEELASQVESTRRGLSAMAIAMRRRTPPPSADQMTSSQEHKGEEIAPEPMESQAMRSSEDSDSSLSSLDEDYLSYLISILESRNFDH
ncbi:Myb-like dna-binding protein, partial [Globisporangium splendens]